jgi:hypothetical protein
MDELTVPIHHKIYTLCGKQIMLDENLRSQFVTSSLNVMGFIKDA